MPVTFRNFINKEGGATFNLLMAHILFWALGFPLAVEYGYQATQTEVRDIEYKSDGSIPSGVKGSGAFPVSLMIMLVATSIWVGKLVRAERHAPRDGEISPAAPFRSSSTSTSPASASWTSARHRRPWRPAGPATRLPRASRRAPRPSAGAQGPRRSQSRVHRYSLACAPPPQPSVSEQSLPSLAAPSASSGRGRRRRSESSVCCVGPRGVGAEGAEASMSLHAWSRAERRTRR